MDTANQLSKRTIGARTLAAASIVSALLMGAGAAPASAEADEYSVIATFEGKEIALADGWGEAGACVSDADGTRCYRTEAEMDEREGLSINPEPHRPAGEYVALSSCSSSLRLYQNPGFGGSVLHFSTQYTYINLWGYGFNNVTSSYRVGACASYLYDGSSGGAPTYPGSTSAYTSASSMVSGWDNRISSVYIN